jgi:hypothetical protein
MAIGRISGPMLFSNLERQGVDLAFQSNLLYLDMNNLRVGVVNSAPQYSFDASGNVKLSNIIITQSSIRSNTGVIDLGSTSNIRISGGAANYVLYTDGAGNISWGEISSLDAQWGNITLLNNTIGIVNTDGNLVLQANGTGSVTTTNNFYAGNVYASNLTGNIQSNGGVFSGNISAPWFTGNVESIIVNVVSGNILTLQTSNFSTANALITGGVLNNIDVQSNNFSTANALITGGVLNNIDVQANNFSTGNALISGGVLYNIDVQANNVSTGNAVISGGYISSLTNAYITTSSIDNFSTGNALISGGVLYNIDVQSNNFSTANALISGGVLYNIDVQANNFSTGNALITGGNVTANITGNTTGTFGSFTGNVDASWLVGNVNGTTGNFGNVNITSNLSITGNLIASGNIIAQKLISPIGDLHLSAATNDPNNIIRFDSVSALDIASGTTDQRPPNPDSGYLRYNTDQGSIEWWSGSQWIQGAQTITSEIINPDGINDTFTLNQSTTENSILVNINGTIQQAGSGAYSVVADQITFAEIPLVTDIIEIRYIAGGVASLSIDFANIASNVSPSANVTYSLGSPTKRWKDLWLSGTTIYIGAANISTVDSNVIITNPSGGSFTVSGSESGNATATFGNVYSKAFYFANGTPFTSSTYGNTEVAAYLLANPQGNFYSNANVTAYIPTDTTILAMQANITAANLWIANAATQADSLISLLANAAVQEANLAVLVSNAASQQSSFNVINANIGAYHIYANANIGAYQTYANANVAAIQANLGAYQTYANANVVTIQANLGAYQIWSNANAATQQGNITSLRARAFTSVMVFGG